MAYRCCYRLLIFNHINNKTMNTKKYLEELLEGSGHLNPFRMKTNDKSPDYGGYIKIDDKIYRVSAWVKNKGGKKSISLKAVEADSEGSINSL